MPRSIVVVDDEKLVMYGICSLLAEHNTDFRVVASCSSGEEGLRFCIENPPDLLMTDLGMPGMSGLELIEKLRQTNPDIKIIVLSCHDEYDMVHRAFVLGADDYILKKDIDKDNLFGILGKLLPEQAGAQSVASGSRMISYLSDEVDFTPAIPGSLGIIGFKSESGIEDAERFWQPDIPMLHQLIKDALHPYGKFYLGLRNDLVVFFPDLCLRDENKIDRILEKARLIISKYINRTVFIAKYLMDSNENIITAYKKGVTILDGLFYYTESSVLTRQTTAPLWKSPLIFSLSDSSPEQSWSRKTDEFFNMALEQLVSPEAVKAELIFAVKHLLHHIQVNIDKDFCLDIAEKNTPYYKITSFSDLYNLKKWIHDFLIRIVEAMESERYGCTTVSRVKLIIGENLQHDLRLSVVADSLGINANHLSTIFKKQTGQSYVEYINRLRIEHACELLDTTDFSAKEVAYRCGYLNPNYFSRLFKKITKTTVSEYRSGQNCKL